jgi:hypothetical protein
MKYVWMSIFFIAFSAHADLYRWVDRETGSVKFSNTPPPWFGDPERERGAPAVEVVPYRGPGAPPKSAAAPEVSPATAGLVASLEMRWTSLVRFFATLPPATDLSRAGIQHQVEAYQALSAELDRLDPAGMPRRRAQEAGIFETLRRAREAQVGPKPPAPSAAEGLPSAEAEARWRQALQQVAAIAGRPEPARSMPELQDALRTLEALHVELNRLDPSGAAAREGEVQATLERVRRGLEAAR